MIQQRLRTSKKPMKIMGFLLSGVHGRPSAAIAIRHPKTVTLAVTAHHPKAVTAVRVDIAILESALC